MKHFIKNERGVVIMEFMVLLPVLLLWFAAMIVFYDAFHKWMKFTTSSYAISDLLSRQTIVDDNYIRSLDNVFDTISDTRSPEDTWLRVTSIKKQDSGIEILWSVNTSTTTQPDVQVSDFSNYVPNTSINEHLLIIQTTAPFIPAFDWVGLNSIVLNEIVPISSRFSSKLENLDHLNYDKPSDDGVDNPLE